MSNTENKLQHFEFGTIKRSKIKLADYNPRLIDESNLKKLVSNIRTNGLVEPVVWNKRTGVLVGGHQRLLAADKIYRSKDYDVPVAIVDVGEQKEKTLNVVLNNPSMQGDWDLDRLTALKVDDHLDFKSMGFDDSDLAFMFGDDTDDGASDKDDEVVDSPVEDEKDKLALFNEKKADFRHADKDETIIDFYVKVVFPDNETKQKVLRACQIPDYEQYIRWDDLKRYFK
ncbi:ParB N-terminal domain-containing protein [Levilactobacillus wangkuiensis]|uniref:ParB N-terminal domain-containing protein n=1 Tax=Levilactobacillus wangkuiensis TaxID=2799566 RepID=UPI0019506E65|nr:ParB/RepB/Spo0J family partition protein [Levilactobacillus wangkuiensis]